MENREIKFRAWDAENKTMYANVICGRDVVIVEINEDELKDGFIDPDYYTTANKMENGMLSFILMQFTGFSDKNGKEVYEGDYLKYSDDSDVSHHRIFWDKTNGRWDDDRLEDGDSNTHYYGFDFVKDCKIIGNIYENPELLKS